MRKLCSHSAKERELNNDVKVNVQTMRPSGKPIRHEKRCNRHEKTIRSPWTSISRSWEIDPSVAKIFEAFRYQLKHVAPSMVKSRVEVISSGDKPFRGDQENHVLVRCTSSNQNRGDKNFRCKIGNAWTYDEICNTLSRNTSSLCLLCCLLPFDPRLMLSATVWGGDQATPVPVGANSVQSVAGLEVNLPEGYACALENWEVLARAIAVVAPPTPTNVLRFVRCWCKFASSAKGERKVSTRIAVERLNNYIEVDNYTGDSWQFRDISVILSKECCLHCDNELCGRRATVSLVVTCN